MLDGKGYVVQYRLNGKRVIRSFSGTFICYGIERSPQICGGWRGLICLKCL